MGLILLLSSDTGSSEHTGALLRPLLRALWPGATDLQVQALHGLIRKGAHFTEYGVLAALWYRAFRVGLGARPRTAGVYALAASAAWAMVDEGFQALVISRTASAVDVAIDAAGAAAASVLAANGWRAADVATRLLLGLATAGGVLVLALNLTLGLPGGWLWLTTPAAAVVFLLYRRPRGRGAATPSGEDPGCRADRPRRD
jgi:VanZ family protein